MTLGTILFIGIIIALIIWLLTQNKMPQPFNWIFASIVIVVLILFLLGLIGALPLLNTPIGR